MKKLISQFLLIIIIISSLIIPSHIAQAYPDTFGDYSYTQVGEGIRITDYTGLGGDITIPTTLGGLTVTEIGSFAFKECTSLTSVVIPNSVTNIDGDAFRDCTNLNNISIGSGVTSFYGRFYGCNKLTTINVSSNNRKYSSLDGIVYNKDLTSIICYPPGKSGPFVIPVGVRGIGMYAFTDCNGLTSVSFPSNVSIGYYAFCGCNNLTSVSIESGQINSFAFFQCSELTNVNLGNGVTRLNYEPMYGTDSPSFEECSKLTAINVSSDNYVYSSIDGVVYNKSMDTLICYPEGKSGGSFIIPDSVTSIGDYALRSCKGLTSVSIPDSVTTIGYAAISNCTNLTNLTIGSGVNLIRDYAFNRCTGLNTIYAFPSAAPAASSSTFENVPSTVVVCTQNGATGYDLGQWASFNKIESIISVTGVSLNKNSSAINVGANDILTAALAPTTATNKNVTWKSSNTAVATVDSNGKVIGVKAGTAVITVTTMDGSKTATCTVTVTGIIPTRLAGTTAEQTAVSIAEQTGWTGTAILASSTSYGMVDALTPGPLASYLKAPILLTGAGNTLDAATKAELVKLAVTKVYVTSGTAVIKQGVLDDLEAMNIQIIKLGGYDRFETSVNIAKKMVGVTIVAVANGLQDALSIASIASANNQPILITSKDVLPASVAAFLAENSGITASDVIGGTGVISDAVKNALPNATRHAGNTAYDTNNQVIQDFAADLEFDNIYVANGVTGIDALAGAPLAAQTKSAIVLIDGKSVPAVAAFVNSKLTSNSVVTALGGAAVVPEYVLAGFATPMLIHNN